MVNQPNIVIFLADEMRGDTVNNPFVQIPNIDSLGADSGVVFSENFAVSPICSPSRCSIFTGQYIHNSGHRSLYQLLEPQEENLFKFLKNNGYEVVWVGRNDLFQKRTGKKSVHKKINFMPTMIKKIYFRMPFTTKIKLLVELIKIYIFRRYPIFESSIFNLIEPYFKINPFSMDDVLRKSFYFGKRTKLQAEFDTDEILTQKIIKFLDSRRNRRRKKPLCLYVAFSFPHPPYTVEEPYFSMYDRKSVPDLKPVVLDDKPKFMKLMNEKYRLNELQDSDFKEIRSTYYGMITKLDDLIGRIINKLKEVKMYDNTAFFFTADHGDYAGDYGLIEKWPSGMQDSLLHVPLIVKIPNIEPIEGINTNLTQTIDIFPTILEIAGIKTKYTHFGKSLIPIIKNEVSYHRDAVFAGGGYDTREPQCFEEYLAPEENPIAGVYFDKIDLQNSIPETVCRSQMIRTKEWKLVMRSLEEQGEELYNIKNDPDELVNLINDSRYKKQIENMKEQLIRFFIKTSDNPPWEHKREF